MHSGLALEIHPRKAQKDRKSKHKEKGHIWVSKESPFISSLLYASSSLLRDSRELTYYWVEHPVPEAHPPFPSFMGKHIFYSILEIPIQSLFSSLFLIFVPLVLHLLHCPFIHSATFDDHYNKFKDTKAQQRNDKVSNISHRELSCSKK